MILVVMLLIFIFFLLADLVPIYQSKQWKLLWIYSASMLLVLVLTLLVALNIKIPSPAAAVERVVSAIWGREAF